LVLNDTRPISSYKLFNLGTSQRTKILDSFEIPFMATNKEGVVMVAAKTDLFEDVLKGIYRCVICECLLMDMAEDQINVHTKEDLLTEGDLERIHFDISATIEPTDYRTRVK
jgi:hypothetical protein